MKCRNQEDRHLAAIATHFDCEVLVEWRGKTAGTDSLSGSFSSSPTDEMMGLAKHDDSDR